MPDNSRLTHPKLVIDFILSLSANKEFIAIINCSSTSSIVEKFLFLKFPFSLPIMNYKLELINYFIELEDPRVDRTKDHLLEDIIFITIAAVFTIAKIID